MRAYILFSDGGYITFLSSSWAGLSLFYIHLMSVYCTSIITFRHCTLQFYWKDSSLTISPVISVPNHDWLYSQSSTSWSLPPSIILETFHSGWKAMQVNGNTSIGCQNGASRIGTRTDSPPHVNRGKQGGTGNTCMFGNEICYIRVFLF